MVTLVLAALACACGTDPVRPAGAPFTAGPYLDNSPVDKVTGGGRVDVSGVWPAAADAQLAITVSNREGGETRGTLTAQFSVPDEAIQMDITCLAVDGDEAWIGGTVTWSHPSGSLLGNVYVVRLRDNGEGDATPADRISFFRAGGPLGPDRCLNKPTHSEFDLLFPLVSGNLTIH
jgi:hypothetical protein